jgi:hypothetical protein
MATNGGTAGNFTQQDCNFMRAYAWRNTSRPWLQPTAMAEAYTVPVKADSLNTELVLSLETDSEVPACNCKRDWLTAIQQSLTHGPWV